jgi:hypothetical protein
MLDKKFIDSRKAFIAQFDGLEPKNGEQIHVKRLAEQYKDNLATLEGAQSKVISMFSLGEVNEKKMKKHEKYPAEIHAYHTAFATVLGGSIITTLYLGTGYLLGGANMEAWSSTLMIIGGTVGAIPAIPACITSYVMNKKNFDRDTLQGKKLHFFEKMIMKRVVKKERAFSLLAAQIQTNLPEILSGEYSITQTRTVTKTKKDGKVVTREIEEFKDEYKNLPFFTKRKLKKVIKKVNSEYSTLTDIEKELKLRVEEIKRQKQAALEEAKKRAEQRTVENEVVEEEREDMVEGQLTIDDIQVAKPAPKKKTSNVYAEGEQLSFFDVMEESEEVGEAEEQKGDKKKGNKTGR